VRAEILQHCVPQDEQHLLVICLTELRDLLRMPPTAQHSPEPNEVRAKNRTLNKAKHDKSEKIKKNHGRRELIPQPRCSRFRSKGGTLFMIRYYSPIVLSIFPSFQIISMRRYLCAKRLCAV
jgi:hypothetical protein